MSQSIRRILLGVVICCSGAATAGDPAGMPEPPTFAEIDANGDQLITEDEFFSFTQQMMAERGHNRLPGGRMNPFERADADGDGALNEKEFNQLMNRMRQMRPPAPPDDEIAILAPDRARLVNATLASQNQPTI